MNSSRPTAHLAAAPATTPAASTETLSPAPLTDDDGQRLMRFFALHRDLLALAADTGAPLVELLAWVNQPRITAAIELIDRHRKEGQAAAVAETLVAELKQTADPAETRRHANTILRSIRPPAQRRAARQQEPTTANTGQPDTQERSCSTAPSRHQPRQAARGGPELIPRNHQDTRMRSDWPATPASALLAAAGQPPPSKSNGRY
jgi:hypothetical protein